MSHPQNDFTSQFQSDGTPAAAALTLIVNGNYHTYTPSGNDKTVNIPGVFRIYETESGADIVSDIQTALGADSVPALVVETPNHNEDQYMYEGTIDVGWVFRHVGDKTIDTITVNTNGTLIYATYDLNQTLYVTIDLDNGTPVTTTSWEDINDAYNASKSIIVKKQHDGGYEVFHLKTVYSVGGKNVYVFESEQFKYNNGSFHYHNELESYSASYITCHLSGTSTVWDFDTYLSLTEDQRRTYIKPFVDLLLSKKQNILGWAVVNVPIGVDSYVKVCELNSATGSADSYYTAFSVADGDGTSSGAIPICVESGVFEIQANCHTNARAKARWSKYKSENNEIYGSTIKEAAIVLNGTKVEVWLKLHTLNSDTRIFIQAIDNKDKDGALAFNYSNAVVNASTTQYDTAHTLYTYPTISSQESVTIKLSQFLHSEAAVYTALDAAWKELKPIFICDDDPPGSAPSVKYYIAHRNGDTFYGLSYDPTNAVDSITLAYSASTWTVTRSLGLVNNAIENKVLTIYQATLNIGTDDEKDALNAKMNDVAYNGGIIILYSNTNDVYILTQYPTSDEYCFTRSQNSNSTSFDSDTLAIQYSTATHSFSAAEHHVVIDQKDVVYRIDGNDNMIFANPSYFSTQLDNVITSKRPIEYFYTSGSVTNHYIYSHRLIGVGYKTYTFERTYLSDDPLLIVEVVKLKYDSVTDNLTRTTTKCSVSYSVIT